MLEELLEFEIPKKWVAVILSALAACTIFGWVYIDNSKHDDIVKAYAKCMSMNASDFVTADAKAAFLKRHREITAEQLETWTNSEDKKESCLGAIARHVAQIEAEAACAGNKSSKIQKCEWISSADVPGVARQMVDGRGTDIKIVTFLRYRDDWGDVQYAYNTVRLIRASADDPDWHVAKSEFSLQRE